MLNVKVWWPLFVLSFVIVLTCLIIMLFRLKRFGATSRAEWVTSSLALIFYVLTFALGRVPFLHKPMSNIAELFILYNAVYFFRKGRKDIFWLNAIALLSIVADFSLHYILK
ncbi:MAG: hypothetical protein ACYDBV_10125 [Nitrospiria bacterium]